MLKTLSHIIVGTLLLVAVLALCVTTAVRIPAVQTWLCETGSEMLTRTLGSNVDIGGVSIASYDQIALKNVLLRDKRGDTLLYVEKLTGKIEPVPLMHKRVIVHQIKIDGGTIGIKRDEGGYNFDHIAEKLKSDKEMDLFLHFGSIKTERLRVRYDDVRVAERGDGVFDPRHMDFEGVSLRMSLDQVAPPDSIVGEIKHLAAVEKSGLTIEDVRVKMWVGKVDGAWKIVGRDIALEMPQTHIGISEARVENMGTGTMQDATFSLQTEYSEVNFKDLAALVPGFGKLDRKATLQARVKGTIDQITADYIDIGYGNGTYLHGKLSISGLPDRTQTMVFAQIDKMNAERTDVEALVAALRGKPTLLPERWSNLRRVGFSGKIVGGLNEMGVDGTIGTNLGAVRVDATVGWLEEDAYYYKGEVGTVDFQAGKLLKNEALGNLSARLTAEGDILKTAAGKWDADCDIDGTLEKITFRDYTYTDISAVGHYEGRKFNGNIAVDDPNGEVNLRGLIDLGGRLPVYNFEADVRGVNLHAMKLMKGYPDLELTFETETDLRGNSMDNLDGAVSLKNITLKNGEKQLDIERLELLSELSDTLSNVTVSSDYLYGSINGRFTLSTFVSGAKYVLSEYVPVLHLAKRDERAATDNNFDFDLMVSHMDTLCKVMDIGWMPRGDVNLFGFYDDATRKFRIRGLCPELTRGNLKFSDVLVSLDNPEEEIVLGASAYIERTNKPESAGFEVGVHVAAVHDSIKTTVQWNNEINAKTLYAGELKTETLLTVSEDGEKLNFLTEILPTEVVLGGDKAWTMNGSRIDVKDGKVKIENFKFSQGNEMVYADGIISKDHEESLLLNVNGIRLGILDKLFNMSMIKLDGEVTGEASIFGVLDRPDINAEIGVKDFSFNNSVWGDVDFKTTWDRAEEKMMTTIDVDDEGRNVAHIEGNIYPTRNIELDLDITADRLPIDFLGGFMENILQRVNGYASAKHLKMGGPLVRPEFTGDVYIENGNFDIDLLGTHYIFSDTLKMTPTSFGFKNIRLYDTELNYGTVSGDIRHTKFRNFDFDVQGNCKNIIALNTEEGDNDLFYGKVYASGKVRIYGTPALVRFDIGMKTEAGSRLCVPISSSATASENTFITYERRDTIKYVTDSLGRKRRLARPTGGQQLASEGASNIDLNLQVEATPLAEMQLILDPEMGDVIKAHGSGNLRMEYNSMGLKMYGLYALTDGTYNFTLQNIIRRNFKIREGSEVKWTGVPWNPQINLTAYYATTASLLDLLDDSMLQDVRRSTVAVNCLLNLTGDLSQPDIKFDIELPNSTNDDVERQVRNVISSDEMMNREILYLLSIGRFYKPDYMSTKTSTGNDFASVLCSTVSAQLNQWLSQINENLSMGVNYRSAETDERSATEVDVELGATMLNHRLVLGGNVGYRNDVASTTDFVGDFDAEYKLNKSGNLRVKAYTHSNDKYYLKNATTQGAGFVYKEDFDTWGGLMNRYKNVLFGRKKRKAEKRKEQLENEGNMSDEPTEEQPEEPAEEPAETTE